MFFSRIFSRREKNPESKPDFGVREKAMRLFAEGKTLAESDLPEEQRNRVSQLLSGDVDKASAKPKVDNESPFEASHETMKPLIQTLRSRFGSFADRHPGVRWADVEESLLKNPKALFSLQKLEDTGGEPELVGIEGDEFIFEDRSKESPNGRRALTFGQANAQRKSFGPNVRFQSPDSYKAMQKTGKFDLNSSSWLETNVKNRITNDAMRGNRKDGVYEFHAGFNGINGGWRASLRVKKA